MGDGIGPVEGQYRVVRDRARDGAGRPADTDLQLPGGDDGHAGVGVVTFQGQGAGTGFFKLQIARDNPIDNAGCRTGDGEFAPGIGVGDHNA